MNLEEHGLLHEIKADVVHIRATLDGSAARKGLVERLEIMESEAVTKRLLVIILTLGAAIGSAWASVIGVFHK